MSNFWWLVLLIFVVFISPYLYELALSLTSRRTRRKTLYQAAVNRSRDRNKPLLVVGDPDTGCINHYLGRDYQCGDVCLDLTGCPKCPPKTRKIKGSLEQWLPTLATNGYVVFVSCTLEYVDHIDLVIRELKRVSGGDLFVVGVEPSAPLHFLFDGSHRIITRAPPTSSEIEYWTVPASFKTMQRIFGPLSSGFMKGHYKGGVPSRRA